MKTGRAQVVEPARYKEMTSVLFHALSARVRVHACAGKQKRENISLKKKETLLIYFAHQVRAERATGYDY